MIGHFTLLCGPPASGKTVWRFANAGFRTVTLSPDDNLGVGSAYHWTPDRLANAWRSCWTMLGNMVNDDKSYNVIFDAVFLTPVDRCAPLNIVRGTGARIVVVAFNTPKELCIERNLARPVNRRVPPDTMNTMLRKWTVPTPDECDGASLIVI
jgi:predicted kinase